MRFPRPLYAMVFSATVCGLSAPAAFAQEGDIDEIVEHIKKSMTETKSWTADILMKMAFQGMSMEWTGDVANRDTYSASNMTIEMMGQKVSMRNIADLDGVIWMEMNMAGMIQVMKSNGTQDASGGSPGLASPGGGGTTQQLLSLLDSGTLTLDGKDTIDGTEVYLISSAVSDDLKSVFGEAGMMAQPGVEPERMKMAFGVDDGFVRRYEMLKEDGTPLMSISYVNLVLNPSIDDSVFSYTPPPGAIVQDVMDVIGGNVELGSPAPDFTGTNLAGESVSLSDYKGKVVLVDFWATWCAPCIQELPNLIEAYKGYHDKGFEILAISLEESRDDLDAFLKEHPEMTWVQLFDGKGWDSEIVAQYNVEGIPFTLLLDREGNVARQDLHGEALANALADLLGG